MKLGYMDIDSKICFKLFGKTENGEVYEWYKYCSKLF